MQLRIKQLVDSSEPKLKSSQMTISQDVTPTSQPGARLQQQPSYYDISRDISAGKGKNSERHMAIYRSSEMDYMLADSYLPSKTALQSRGGDYSDGHYMDHSVPRLSK